VKKLIYFITVLTFFVLNSCKDNTISPASGTKGSMLITSDPGGAAIYLQGDFTGKYTPDTLKDLEFGSYAIMLKFGLERDTTFKVNLSSAGINKTSVNMTNELGSLFLNSDPQGCEIYVNGAPTDKFTPDTVNYLKLGINTITLVKDKMEIDTNLSISKGLNSIFLNYYGTLFITSKPSGVKITIDGINTNKVTPDTLKLFKGVHTLELSNNQYYFSTELNIIAGQLMEMDHSFTDPGNISVTSTPAGASIFLDGVNQGVTSPSVLTNIQIGKHSLVLNLNGYIPDSVQVNVLGSQTSYIKRTLIPKAALSSFGPVLIYYGYNIPTGLPNSLVLSSGTTRATSVGSIDSIDLVSNSYYITSAYSYNSRNTYFGSTSGYYNLNDGVAAINFSSGYYYSQMSISSNGYFFIYDNDQHYSKMIITASGGSGSSTDPYYVKVQWLYNQTSGDIRFR
jgi:hypothetical protein